jgi:hypothetical protein
MIGQTFVLFVRTLPARLKTEVDVATKLIPLTVSSSEYRRLEWLARQDARGPFAMAGVLLKIGIEEPERRANTDGRTRQPA